MEPANDLRTSAFDDPLAKAVFFSTSTRWNLALHNARSMHDLPPNALDLDALLVRIPALPARIPNNFETIGGYSTWVNESISTCDLRKMVDPSQTLHLRMSKYITCSLSTDASFQVWGASKNNGMSLLVLGWAYILNASLAERQELQLHHQAIPTPPFNSPHRISLAYATKQEVYWWKTIITPGTFCLDQGGILPWTVMLDDVCSLEIVGASSIATPESMKLPRARTAATYLARLCAAYDLGNQSSAAFAAALCLPTRAVSNPKEKKINLPAVSLSSFASLPRSHDIYPPHFKSLSHFMTLSLATNTFKACLESVIWEPDITCNLGGAVLQAANQVLGPILRSRDYELLAKVLSHTKAAPLWLGSSLCNWRYPLSVCLNSGDYFSRKSAEIAPWTGIAQSFFDLETDGPYLQSDNTVSRTNIWRLRRDCSDYYPKDENYREAPLHPWPPFGVMRAKDIDMELQSHLRCTHHWKYQYWTWLLPKHISDRGYVDFHQPDNPMPSLVVMCDRNTVDEDDCDAINQISRHLTERIFSWCYHQVEEGFTNTIVPRRWASHEPPEQPNQTRLALEAIVSWRDGVINS